MLWNASNEQILPITGQGQWGWIQQRTTSHIIIHADDDQHVSPDLPEPSKKNGNQTE